MDPHPPESKEPREPVTSTLGDLLRVGLASAQESESDWVGLVRAVGEGDQRALQGVFDRANRLVFTLSFRITGNRETAEEVTLDVFHDVWRRATRYDPADGSVLGWIMNIARSRAIDRLRFEHRRKRLAGHGNALVQEAPGPEPHARAQALDQGRQLTEALHSLTILERQAIEVAYFSGLSYAETAGRLDVPLGTIKTRIRSALAKLRRALHASGGEA